MESQLPQYIAVLMLFVLAVAATGGMILLSTLLGKRGASSKIKDTAYECGMIPIGPGGTRMSVKFYLVAMLFILFDIEVVFMYPWAAIYKENAPTRSDAKSDSRLDGFLPGDLVRRLHLRREETGV